MNKTNKSMILKSLAGFCICAMLLSACGGSKENTSPSPSPSASQTESAKPVEGSISEYFPFRANTSYEYAGVQSEKYDQNMYLGYINGNRIQRRLSQLGKKTTEVMILENGELRLTFGDPNYYYYDDITDANASLNYVILKEPLNLGNTWSLSGEDTTGITGLDVPVETPYGSFNAVEVTSTYVNGDKTIYYYAKGIGLVKCTDIVGGVENSYALKAIVENTGIEVATQFFWFGEDDYEIKWEPRMVPMKTNENFTKVFEEELKKKGENFRPLLTENTKVNSIKIDRINSIMTLDLSKEFIDEMQLGAGGEGATLQCLSNTLGIFYDVKKVQFKIDGEKYSSGHFELGDNDYYDVEGHIKTDGQNAADSIKIIEKPKDEEQKEAK